MNSICADCIERFATWGADPRNDGSCTSYACNNPQGQQEREIEHWGEYIVNGTKPRHLPTPSQEIKKAINVRDHREVVELSRKVENLNKALANHLAEKPKKYEKVTYK